MKGLGVRRVVFEGTPSEVNERFNKWAEEGGEGENWTPAIVNEYCDAGAGRIVLSLTMQHKSLLVAAAPAPRAAAPRIVH